MNDAPALAKAQIGIAVHGATDAAKSAGDIVLTKDGLSPIFTAIQRLVRNRGVAHDLSSARISRRIFKRLKSYVIYRICITVQVVFFLAALAIFYNLRFKAGLQKPFWGAGLRRVSLLGSVSSYPVCDVLSPVL